MLAALLVAVLWAVVLFSVKLTAGVNSKAGSSAPRFLYENLRSFENHEVPEFKEGDYDDTTVPPPPPYPFQLAQQFSSSWPAIRNYMTKPTASFSEETKLRIGNMLDSCMEREFDRYARSRVAFYNSTVFQILSPDEQFLREVAAFICYLDCEMR